MPKELKLTSRDLLVGPDRAPARAMLKAVGFTDEDLSRPIIGVANTWIEVMPCNFHLRRLSERVKAGIRAAGGTPIEYNTIAVSDGISMGTEGMKASLISREVIADSIELVARGHLFDGVVALSGCDKTIPGTVMALARLNLPSMMLYGGSIMPGQFQGHDVTIQDVFEAVGKHASGKMTNAELKDLEELLRFRIGRDSPRSPAFVRSSPARRTRFERSPNRSGRDWPPRANSESPGPRGPPTIRLAASL